jgi:RNA-directed DNA polymerase
MNPYLLNEADYKKLCSRIKYVTELNVRRIKLWNKQKGICPICLNPLYLEEIEVHHVKPVKSGRSDKLSNLLLLHKVCHKQITYSKNEKLLAG